MKQMKLVKKLNKVKVSDHTVLQQNIQIWRSGSWDQLWLCSDMEIEPQN